MKLVVTFGVFLLFIAVSRIWQMGSLRLFCDKLEKGCEMRFLKEFGSQAISAERDNHSDSRSTIDGIVKAINHKRVDYPFEIIGLLECIARHLKDSSNARTLWRLLVYYLVPFAILVAAIDRKTKILILIFSGFERLVLLYGKDACAKAFNICNV